MLSTLANAWADAGHTVTFFTFEPDGPKEFELSAAIQFRQLPMASVSANPLVGLMANLRRLRTLRSAVRESHPEVVVSFTSSANVLTILAAAGLGVPVIVSERTDPWEFKIGRIWSALRGITYPSADAVVCQTESVAARLRRSTRQKIVVIPNPVALRGRYSGSGNVGASKQMFAMGRLDPAKGFDLLLHAFQSIARQHPEWSLRILGEGPERQRLEALVDSLGLRDRVSMPGWARDPFSQLAGAELFVLSSRVEGFPNALCEAMACGVPVIAFDCPSGPGDIVRHEVDGLLAPPEDVHALASAMGRLINDPDERARMRLRAPEVVQRFGVEDVLQRWRALFEQVTDSHRRRAISPGAAGQVKA